MEITSWLLDDILSEYIQEWDGKSRHQDEVELAKAIKEEIAKSDKVLLIEIPF